jgi:hypothetical protein
MDNMGITMLVRLPSFSGLRKDFQTWWIQFVAYVSVCGFLVALEVGGETTMPASNSEVIDLTDDAGKENAAAKQRNAVATANFTMAFETKSLLGMIYKTMSKMLNGVSMKDAQEDPSILFEQISAKFIINTIPQLMHL